MCHHSRRLAVHVFQTATLYSCYALADAARFGLLLVDACSVRQAVSRAYPEQVLIGVIRMVRTWSPLIILVTILPVCLSLARTVRTTCPLSRVTYPIWMTDTPV